MTSGSALVCTYGVPRSDSDSGSCRIMSHVQFLRELGWHVDFYAVNGAGPEQYDRVLERAGVAVYDPATASFEELVSSGSYDVVLFAFWQTAERHLPVVRQLLPECKVVVDSVDLQLLRDARRRLAWPGGGALGMDYGSEVVGELNVYGAADGVLTVSQKEADLINDFVGDPGRAFTIPDHENLDRSPHPAGRRQGIVFVGSFHHPPNASAVEFLCSEVVPRIRPDLLLRHPVSIVGSGLDATTVAYGEHLDSVRMVGWVPSVVPYIERARISVVPLFYGAGTKRKLLQALMVGTPSVSTTMGIEGLPLEHGRHVLIANDAASFVSSIERLLTSNEIWRRIAREGRQAIRSLHSREVVLRQFVRSMQTILGRSTRTTTLPEPSEELYLQRLRYQTHQKIAPRVAEIVERHVPLGSTLAVIGEGSSELLDFEGRVAVRFPSSTAGNHGGNLGSSSDAIDMLEAAKADGVRFLLLPVTARWRFTGSYPEFASYLIDRHDLLERQEDVCELYLLDRSPPASLQTFERREPRNDRPLSDEASSTRLIAFYLPQFHPIAENDEWWGEGFTEWTNVARAQPLFDGHYQPHVPADLGFYDLRLAETRAAQADMAQQFGIAGFCWYHYWFGGKRLMERPFDEVLAAGEPDFPFCLCWANEPWSRRWHGREEDVLQPQTYSDEDDLAHIRWLLPALSDARALRIHGRPIFVVYQARDLPDPARTVETWRSEVARAGLPDPYLMTVETGWDEGWDATRAGFDAKILFRPQFTILRRAPRLALPEVPALEVHDYSDAWPILAEPEELPYPTYETVCPRWDNSPRTGSRAVVLHNATPEAYERWLELATDRAASRTLDEQIVFVNAWNEWGEGCHLEPDRRFGRAFLEATRRVLLNPRSVARPSGTLAELLASLSGQTS